MHYVGCSASLQSRIGALPREITSEAIFDITFFPGSFEVLLTLRRVAPCSSLFAVRPRWSLVTCHFGKSSAAFAFNSQPSTLNFLLKRFLIQNIWHLRRVAPVVPFQHVDHFLGGAP